MTKLPQTIHRKVAGKRTATLLNQTVTLRAHCRQRLSLRLVLCLLSVAIVILPASVLAQTFQALPALSFDKAYQGTNPLPQVITVASVGPSFSYGVTSVTNITGGSWLSINANGCCYTTPQGITVTATPDPTLAPGTYTAQILLKSSNGLVSMAIPLSLTIAPASTAYFDALPGGITFSMTTGGTAPPSQPLQIRNGVAGTLSYTASTTTSDGGGWLTLSQASGTAPSLLSVSLNPAKLPGGGSVAGTFTGQVVLQENGVTVTVPVTVALGSAVFRQINALNFTKAQYALGTPLAQVISVASVGTDFSFGVVEVVNATGGNWLSINASGCCYTTPQEITVTAAPDNSLVAGTYTAEIILYSSDGHQTMVIPVTLTIADATLSDFFDQVPGGLTFSMLPGGTAPPPQPIAVRNAGAGTLDFTASVTTADGGPWLTLSAPGGVAPSLLSVAIDPTRLPNGGNLPGTFTGQVLLQTNGDRMTVPVTVTVGASVFRQINPLNFTKALYDLGSPLPQVITVASTGTNFSFGVVKVVNATGGNWLSINASGCCYTTPQQITVTAIPDPSLAAGTYTAEIILYSSDGHQTQVVPASLTVVDASASAFFDQLPGGLTFSMLTGGTAPPSQPLQVRNAGAGTLSFTASANTADGGTWLTLSATSGAAPSLLNVSINPARLPNGGSLAGTFTGQVVLQANGSTATVPVSVTVGAAVFRQINPLNFTKAVNAPGNPLPQVITVASTGANFGFGLIKAVSATGGSWLSLNASGCCYTTPNELTVTATPDQSLGAGTYTAEIVLDSSDGHQSLTVPVTLTVADPTTSAFFDGEPGALTFSGPATGAVIPSLPLPIFNGGQGILNWVAGTSTSDGGDWLTLSFTSGTAPSAPNVTINPIRLPNQGKIAGTFTGEITLQTFGDLVTVPVVVTLGSAVFEQQGPLTFTKSVQGTNPSAQTITIASTGTNFSFGVIKVASATGGNWLFINASGCCYSTPQGIMVSANPDASLKTGFYAGEIDLATSTGTEPLVIPVNLYVGTTPIAAPNSITLVSGYGQSAVVGSPFSAPLVVQVNDANGPLANAHVSFSGTGLAFSSSTAVTNSAGQASVTATPILGGVLNVTASVAGGTPFVLFNETGVATASTTPPAFSSMAILATGASASGISPVAVAGDFNGDGLQDLATANLVDASVSVLLGKGNGSFQTAASYGVGHGPYGLAAGDFNGDGKLDLAVVNGLDNTVSVLLNKGAGAFAATPSFTCAVGGQPYGVSAADLNRDGVLDLIVTNNADKTISVLLGNGDGSFRAQTTYATGGLPFGTAIADMNGDGYPDVIAWNYADNTISVLLNDKTGRFAAQAIYATGAGPYGVSVGDFNGDGYPDVAVANLGLNTVSVLLNDKTGKLLPAIAYPVGSLPISVLAADLNGDGVLDLTVTNLGDGTISLLLGKGNGTFQPQTKADAGTQPYGVLAADFNGDSKPDLAVTSFFTPSIGVLLQNPSAASIKMKGTPKKPIKVLPTTSAP